MTRSRFLALSALALLAACGSDATGPAYPGAVVRFAFTGHPADTLRVLVRDRATVDAAVHYIVTGAGPHIPNGTIVRGAGADARYPFHFEPDSVRLADAAIELCDGAPMRTGGDVDEFFSLSGPVERERARWCPWGAYPIGVELPD
jgi:hypothetical protein